MDFGGEGCETFESVMASLGLTERKPVPEPVKFDECDPLGHRDVQADVNLDIVSSLSKFSYHHRFIC